ncbi:MAG: hypothetical protein QMD02_06995 [Bacteroidales bacterium]|nr:hypothetical protein [Bacteroidales bacterium]
MKKLSIILIVLISLLIGNNINAQNLGIGPDTFDPHASAGVEMRFTNKGLLIPRVALTSTSSASPITSPATSLLVYNTATAGDVTPGYYYWNGSKWMRLLAIDDKPAWLLSGNAAAASDFIGTTNAIDFRIYTSNVERMTVEANGNVGIGTSTPAEKLHINGSIRGNQSGALRISTGNGYIDIGPKNTSWAHFYTDRSRYWFSTGLTIETGNIGSFDENLSLQTSGTTRITILNSNGNVGIGTTTPQTALHVASNSIFNDGFEDGTLSPFTTGGDASWVISTTSPYAGSYCAESGTITHSQSTYIQLTQSLSSPGQISFAYKTSTESCCDKLKFYIDGNLMGDWGGELSWTVASFSVGSGSHTFKWEYSKDGSVNTGSDKVWIDDIKISYLSDLAIIEGNADISGNADIGGNAIVNGNVGIGTTSPSAKLHVVSTASQNLAYFFQTYNNYMYIQDISATELLYASKQQLTSNGDGQSTIYGYRNRDSQNDGTGYGVYTSNGAVKGYNYWGDLYSYGVGGFNWNDYTRCGGVLGAQYSGSYWASLGYKNSGSTTYGAYWTSSGSGSGYSATGSAMAGVGAGGYGDMLGLWSRGEVMGAIFAGELFSAYNLGNTYTSGTQVELVKTDNEKTPAYTMTSTEIKIYADGLGHLSGNEIFINYDNNFKKLLGETAPIVTITPIGKSADLYIKSISKDGFIVASDTPQDIQFTWIAVGTRIDNKEAQRVPEELTDINFDSNLVDFMFNENIKERNAKAMWWDGNKIQFGTLPDFFHQADREAKQAELEKMKLMEEKNNNFNTEKKLK